jgi:hypothetical protein
MAEGVTELSGSPVLGATCPGRRRSRLPQSRRWAAEVVEAKPTLFLGHSHCRRSYPWPGIAGLEQTPYYTGDGAILSNEVRGAAAEHNGHDFYRWQVAAMSGHTPMRKRLRVPVLLGIALFAALLAAAFSTASVSFRSAQRDSTRVAEVLIGERIVIVLRTDAGGHSALERAEIIASRLRAALADQFAASDVRVSTIASGHGLFIGDRLVVAVYEEEAAAHGADTEALAALWRDNVLLALGLEAAPEAAAPPAEREVQDEDHAAIEADAAEHGVPETSRVRRAPIRDIELDDMNAEESGRTPGGQR